MRLYTPEESQKFIELYPVTNTEKLAKMLGRSPKALHSRASSIGLKKTGSAHGNRAPNTSTNGSALDKMLRMMNDTQNPHYNYKKLQEATKSKTAQPWDDEDDTILKTLYPKTKTKDLAIIIGRSLPAIHTRAKILGLKKCPD